MEIIKVRDHWYNENIDDYFPNRQISMEHIGIDIRYSIYNKILTGIDTMIYMAVSREIKMHLSSNLNYESRWKTYEPKLKK